MWRKKASSAMMKQLVILDNTSRVNTKIDLTDVNRKMQTGPLVVTEEKVAQILDQSVPEVDPWMLTQTFSPVLDRNVPITPMMRKKPFFGLEFAPTDAI